MQSLLHNPFGGSKQAAQKTSSEDPSSQSLNTILNHEQRTELTLLLNNILATQRRSITDIFDPRYAGTSADERLHSPPSSTTKDTSQRQDDSKAGLAAVIQESNAAAAAAGKAKDDDDIEEELERQRHDAEDRIKEISAPETQDLKRAALSYFDDWRESVLVRIGEVVNSREEAKEQVAEAKPVEKNAKDKIEVHDGMGKGKREQPAGNSTTEDTGVDEGSRSDEAMTSTLLRLYPPISTTLTDLPEEQRRLILHSVLLLLLSLEQYSADARVLMLHLTTSLRLPLQFLAEDEEKVAKTLLTAAEEMSAEESRKHHEESTATSKKWKVGIATVAGAALIGITGGLAAPLVAAGIGTVMGGLGLEATVAAAYLGTLASSSVVVGGLFGAYGGRMTGRMMDEYAKEVSDFGFIPVQHVRKHGGRDPKESRRLRVAIGISGWLTDRDEVVKPWKLFKSSIEGFALRFELEALLKLGNALTILLKSTAWGYAKAEIIKHTVLAGLTEALWPLGILKVGKIIDNPYSIAKIRADKAGLVLADALIKKAQGERPVTFVGYSMGARVIYSCLRSLADRKAFGLVENAVLLGTPAPASSEDWRKMRSVVAGRLVNVFSSNDYILAFLYRTSSIQFGVAGLKAADFVKGVENVDVSDVVDGHLRYRFLTGSILNRIGFQDLDVQLVEEDEAEMKVVEAMEQKEREGEKMAEGEGKEGDTDAKAEAEAARLEKEVEEKNEQSMLGWATAKMNLGVENTRSFFTGKETAK